jgi:hypothetical protein
MSRLAAIRYARQHGTWRLGLARIMERRPIKVAAGEPMSSIGRRFDRESSSIFSVISPNGGIRSPDRPRAKRALSFRFLDGSACAARCGRSRDIWDDLYRSSAAKSVAIEDATGLLGQLRPAGIGHGVPSFASWLAAVLEADSIRRAKVKCSAIASRFSPGQWEMSLVGSYRESLREKVPSSASSCRTRGYVARAASMSGCSSATLGHQATKRAGREIRR